MTAVRLATTLLAATVLAACSSTASRIDDQKATFDTYSAEMQQKIREGKVDVGFTQEQVRLSLGEPTRRYTQQTAAGQSEVWAYGKSGPTFSFGLGAGSFGSGVGGGVGLGTSTGGNSEDKMRVTFEGGKVTAVERTQ